MRASEESSGTAAFRSMGPNNKRSCLSARRSAQPPSRPACRTPPNPVGYPSVGFYNFGSYNVRTRCNATSIRMRSSIRVGEESQPAASHMLRIFSPIRHMHEFKKYQHGQMVHHTITLIFQKFFEKVGTFLGGF